MKTAIIVTGHGFTDSEFIYAYYRLLEEEFTVDVCTLDGFVANGEKGTVAKPTMSAKSIKAEGPVPWDVVIIIGGVKNIEKTRQDASVVSLVRNASMQGKILGMICHGVQLAIEADILEGRDATGYYSIEKDIANAGATYFNQSVCVDGKLITSPHYDFNHDFMRAVLKAYYSKD